MTMMQMLLMATSSLTPLPGAYLDLDFASNSYRLADAASSFDAAFLGSSPKLTYTATSNSTMTNSSGNIVWAPHNEVQDSEDFGNTSLWLNSLLTGTLVAAASYTDPTGGNNAYLATPVTGTLNMHQNSIRTVVDGGASGLEYSLSAYFKKPTTNAARYAVLAFSNNSGYSATAHFDLDTVSVSTTGSHNVAGAVNTAKTTIVAVGSDGWYLCTFTVRRDTSLFAAHVNGSTAPGSGSYNRQSTGDGTSGVLVWGAHVYRSDLGGVAPVPGAATGFEAYVPTNGAVEYLPRVGHHVYNGSTWVNEGLLLESEARTNLLTYSADFSESAWLTTFSEFTMDAVGPDGASNSAGTLTDDQSGGTGIAYTQVNVTVSTETTYTFSIFAKADQLSDIQLRCVNFTTPGTVGVYFDLSAGEVGNTTGSGATGEIEDFGSGWYRCSITFTTDVTDTSGIIRIHLANGESASISRDGTSSVLFYGAQLEVGSTPSSYIPTPAPTVTRGGQSLTVPPAEFGWDSAGMSFAMEGRMTYTDSGIGASINGGDQQFYLISQGNVDYIMHGLSTSGNRTGQPTAAQRSSAQDGVSGSLVSSLGGSQEYAPGVLVPYNVSARHSTTGVQGANDGTANSFTATLANKVSLNDLSAKSLEFGVKYMGTIRHFRQWDEDIGETGIEEASS